MGQKKPSTRYTWDENTAWTFEADVDPVAFNKALNPVSAIVDECALSIGPSGVRTMAMDPARVAVVEVATDCTLRTDGEVAIGFNLRDTVQNLPGYFAEHDDYTVTVEHGPETAVFSVSCPSGRDHETTAFDPNTVRDANWPDVEEGYQTEVELPAPKVRGVLGAMAEAGETVLRLRPGDGQLLVEAIDGESIEHSWLLEADVQPGEYQYYATDYLTDLMSEFWPSGRATIRFGKDQPLEVQNETLRFALAPRPHDNVDVENVGVDTDV